MDEGADTGDLLDQKEFEILFEDTAFSIYQKMINTALIQVEIFLPKLQNGSYQRIKQNNSGNTWRKRNIIDGLIDFRMTSEAICNLVRGISKPYAGAHCNFNGEEIKIWEVDLEKFDSQNIEPGKVLGFIGNNIRVKTYNGVVLLKKHEFSILPQTGSYIK
jgi:methionyl-tRNA formyltransferase